jgi:actin-related protein 5
MQRIQALSMNPPSFHATHFRAPMHINLEDIPYRNKYEPCTRSDTIVVDNGTYECRAGYANSPPQMVFRNLLYKSRDQSGIESFQGATPKSMFDADVVINFEVLEGTMDAIIDYLRPEKLRNLIFTEKICSPMHTALVSFLFDVYGFEKIQVGVDSCYSYLYNMKGEDCLVIDMSHSAVTSIVILGGKIVECYKINFGGKAAGDYLAALMPTKCRDSRKSYRSLVPFLRCSLDYNREAVEILEMMRRGDHSRSYFLTNETADEAAASRSTAETQEPMQKRRKKSTASQTSVAMPDIDMALLNTSDAELDAEGVKEKKKQKILFHSTLYRFKQRIEKCLERMCDVIGSTKEERDKLVDLDGFVKRKKEEFEVLKRELEVRSRTRRNAKNRKTYEFQIKFKEGMLSEEEKALIEKIKDAENLEKEDLLLEKLGVLGFRIRELDPSFEPYKPGTLELLTGEAIGSSNANVDLIRVPEILFSPSIVGSEQMGLSEVLEEVARRFGVREVFLTGGFSRMEGIETRILNEMRSFSFNDVNVVRARDPVDDAFKGATLASMFPIYTLEEHKRLGAEKMVELHGMDFY